jgi:hypothetical protein
VGVVTAWTFLIRKDPLAKYKLAYLPRLFFRFLFTRVHGRGALRTSGVGGSRRFEVTKGAEALVRAPTIRPDSPFFGTVDRCAWEVALGALLGTSVIRSFLRYVLPRRPSA